MQAIISIDPGNIESAYTIIEKHTMKPVEIGKIENEELLYKLKGINSPDLEIAIEMIASYGMAVGKTVFDTCVWIGRFTQASDLAKVNYVYRKDVTMNMCHVMTANDSNIIQALVDRFADNPKNHGKGTKKEPGFFYGFSKDIWQAYAVGVTYIDNN